MLIKDKGFAVVVIFADILGLFQCDQTGNGTGKIKVTVIRIFTGTLNKDHGFGFLTIGRTTYFALLGEFFKLGIGHHIGNFAITKMLDLIVRKLCRSPSGR